MWHINSVDPTQSRLCSSFLVISFFVIWCCGIFFYRFVLIPIGFWALVQSSTTATIHRRQVRALEVSYIQRVLCADLYWPYVVGRWTVQIRRLGRRIGRPQYCIQHKVVVGRSQSTGIGWGGACGAYAMRLPSLSFQRRIRTRWVETGDAWIQYTAKRWHYVDPPARWYFPLILSPLQWAHQQGINSLFFPGCCLAGFFVLFLFQRARVSSLSGVIFC